MDSPTPSPPRSPRRASGRGARRLARRLALRDVQSERLAERAEGRAGAQRRRGARPRSGSTRAEAHALARGELTQIECRSAGETSPGAPRRASWASRRRWTGQASARMGRRRVEAQRERAPTPRARGAASASRARGARVGRVEGVDQRPLEGGEVGGEGPAHAEEGGLGESPARKAAARARVAQRGARGRIARAGTRSRGRGTRLVAERRGERREVVAQHAEEPREVGVRVDLEARRAPTPARRRGASAASPASATRRPPRRAPPRRRSGAQISRAEPLLQRPQARPRAPRLASAGLRRAARSRRGARRERVLEHAAHARGLGLEPVEVRQLVVPLDERRDRARGDAPRRRRAPAPRRRSDDRGCRCAARRSPSDRRGGSGTRAAAESRRGSGAHRSRGSRRSRRRC